MTLPGGVEKGDPYGPESVAVYRLFNYAGALLYVGISGNPKGRFAQHAADKPWWRAVARWSVQWYPDRATALAEEARAIAKEVPAFNIAGVADEVVVDDVTRVRRWCAALDASRPGAHLLNDLFVDMVRARSLMDSGGGSRARWPVPVIEDVYSYAFQRASGFARRRHSRFVDRWNDEQLVAYYAWRKRPIPLNAA